MLSVCLSSDALSQHLQSYLGFSYLGRGVSLHGCSSKAQPLLLTLDKGYLLTATLPDLQHGIASLGPPAPVQPRLLGRGVGPPLLLPKTHINQILNKLILKDKRKLEFLMPCENSRRKKKAHQEKERLLFFPGKGSAMKNHGLFFPTALPTASSSL